MDRVAAQARLNRIRGFNSELAALEQAGIVAFTWGPAAARARFAATLAVGRRYEPWIAAIEPFDTPSTPH